MIRITSSIENIAYLLSQITLVTPDGLGPLTRQLRGLEPDRTDRKAQSNQFLYRIADFTRWTRAYKIDMMITKDNHKKKKRYSDHKRDERVMHWYQARQRIQNINDDNPVDNRYAEQLVLMRRGNLR